VNVRGQERLGWADKRAHDENKGLERRNSSNSKLINTSS